MRTATSHHFLPFFALIAVILGVVSPASQSVAASEWTPPTTVWIESTGHTVDGYFLDEWRNHDALLGLPITEEFRKPTLLPGVPADVRIIQYFENLAIVYVPEAETRELRVRALPLGRAAVLRDRLWKSDPGTLEKRGCGAASETSCLEFENGFAIQDEVLVFWQNHGAERLIGKPLTELRSFSNGEQRQYFDNAVLILRDDKTVVPRAVGIESAELQQISLKPVPQRAGIPTYDESLFVPPPETVAPVETSNDFQPAIQPVAGGSTEAISEDSVPTYYSGPGPQQGAYKEIVVSISAQTLWAYEGSELVVETLVSTGTAEVPETVTPIGYHSVLVKYDSQTMEGTISDEYYKVEDVPWVMYFDNLGNAIHGTYWHSNFGTPMSHGCVNLPLEVAEFLYYWSPEGTAVTVIA